MSATPTPGDAGYAAAGVDTAAGDAAVELMKSAVAATHTANVLGGVGGFAGLVDVSELLRYSRPILATSTDGVGTKIAIARALDVHDTIGYDLVGMVVDDIVVVGAKPLYMTDYIACGKVEPQRIADIVRGIANACRETGTALVGGETAEHPGVMAPDDYDLAGAATGIVDADALLGPDRVRHGDVVVAIASSGLHSNGFSLVRKIVADRGLDYTATVPEFSDPLGLTLLEPTRLYAAPLVRLFDEHANVVHAVSHVTGGGIAANLARVLPPDAHVELDRSTWTPQPVFHVLADWGGLRLRDVEGTWNLGIGMIAVVDADAASTVVHALELAGHHAWVAGRVATGEAPDAAVDPAAGWVRGAKGVDGGAVRLVGEHPSAA